MESVRDLFVVSHTHWDREWYRSFHQYRMQLLNVIDRLLDLMARVPEFKHFFLDGQTVMLEDYLELRPEHADAVRCLVGEGRLHIGPWYVQPDEFPGLGRGADTEPSIRGADGGETGRHRQGWLAA